LFLKYIFIGTLVAGFVFGIDDGEKELSTPVHSDSLKKMHLDARNSGPEEKREDNREIKQDDSLSRQKEVKADSARVVRHQFKHREQVIVGGVIMACIALILVTMNNYNPK